MVPSTARDLLVSMRTLLLDYWGFAYFMGSFGMLELFRSTLAMANELTSTTAALLDRIESGDHAAMDELFGRLLPPLRDVAGRLLRRFSRIEMDVDELVNEFYLKSFVELGAEYFNTVDHLIATAYQRMYWFVQDTLRIRDCLVPGTHTIREEVSNETGVQTHVEKDDLIEVVWSALETLPVELRTVVQRRLTGELSYAQIAAELGIGAATAHDRFANAINRLRRIVDLEPQ